MQKIFNFGRFDVAGYGTPLNTIEVTVEYQPKKENEMVFSAQGSVWKPGKRDIIMGGQCLDELVPYLKDNKTFMEIYRLWKLYHLNDMHPECVHQAKLGWREKAKEEVTLYHYTLKMDVVKKQKELKEKAGEAAKQMKTFCLTQKDLEIADLPYSCTSHVPFTEKQLENYEPKKALFSGDQKFEEKKTLGWLHEDEHPEGLLGRPCPVCGYKYGHGYNYFPIPKDDEEIILQLLNGTYKE